MSLSALLVISVLLVQGGLTSAEYCSTDYVAGTNVNVGQLVPSPRGTSPDDKADSGLKRHRYNFVLI